MAGQHTFSNSALPILSVAQPHQWTCQSCFDTSPLSQIPGQLCSTGLHFYCARCLESFFRTAVRDETLFPPKCCQQPIPLNPAILPLDIVAQTLEKAEERATLQKTYCANRHCTAFIPTRTLLPSDREATCRRCGIATCRLCRKLSHQAGCDPTADPDEERLHRVARERGWKICPMCERYVERTGGCRHILCRCGTSLCYHCGRQWKTCDCDLFSPEIQPATLAPGRQTVETPQSSQSARLLEDLHDFPLQSPVLAARPSNLATPRFHRNTAHFPLLQTPRSLTLHAPEAFEDIHGSLDWQNLEASRILQAPQPLQPFPVFQQGPHAFNFGVPNPLRPIRPIPPFQPSPSEQQSQRRPRR